jgi:hypothetical protein
MIPTMLLFPYDDEIFTLNTGSRQAMIKAAKGLGQLH